MGQRRQHLRLLVRTELLRVIARLDRAHLIGVHGVRTKAQAEHVAFSRSAAVGAPTSGRRALENVGCREAVAPDLILIRLQVRPDEARRSWVTKAISSLRRSHLNRRLGCPLRRRRARNPHAWSSFPCCVVRGRRLGTGEAVCACAMRQSVLFRADRGPVDDLLDLRLGREGFRVHRDHRTLDVERAPPSKVAATSTGLSRPALTPVLRATGMAARQTGGRLLAS